MSRPVAGPQTNSRTLRVTASLPWQAWPHVDAGDGMFGPRQFLNVQLTTTTIRSLC